jgi:RNase H-like domain found in reverse transcriptase
VIIKAITHWQPYLIWTKEPFTILMNHANLLHWKSPRKLNRRMAHWHRELQDYNFKLHHVPGKLHTAADVLSRLPGANEGKDDNQQMTMIHEAAFIRLAGPDSDGSIELTLSCTHASESYVLIGHESALFHIPHVSPCFPFDMSFPFFLPHG